MLTPSSEIRGRNGSRMGTPREPTVLFAFTSVCGVVNISMPNRDCSPALDPAGTRTPAGSRVARVDVAMSCSTVPGFTSYEASPRWAPRDRVVILPPLMGVMGEITRTMT